MDEASRFSRLNFFLPFLVLEVFFVLLCSEASVAEFAFGMAVLNLGYLCALGAALLVGALHRRMSPWYFGAAALATVLLPAVLHFVCKAEDFYAVGKWVVIGLYAVQSVFLILLIALRCRISVAHRWAAVALLTGLNLAQCVVFLLMLAKD